MNDDVADIRRKLKFALEVEDIRYPQDRMDDLVVECCNLHRFLRAIRQHRAGSLSQKTP